MEAERGEVSDGTCHLAVPLCAERVGIVGGHDDTADTFLQFVGGTEKMFFGFHHGKYLVEITDDAT